MIPAGRFLLRPLVAADAPALAAAVRESMGSLSQWMSWAHAAYGEADALDWIVRCGAARVDGSAHEFAVVGADGHLLGAVGLNQFNHVNDFCNLGYWVRASARRQGVGLAAVTAMACHAFEQLGMMRVEIVVAEGNQPSLLLAQKAGAVLECLARNRLRLHGRSVAAHVLSLVNPQADRQGAPGPG